MASIPQSTSVYSHCHHVLTGEGVPTPAHGATGQLEPSFPPPHPLPATPGGRDKLCQVCLWKKAVGRLTLGLEWSRFGEEEKRCLPSLE